MIRLYCRLVGPFGWVALLVAGGVLLGGCDGGGSKRDSLYQRLANEGPWTITRLDAKFIGPNRHEQRYSEVRVAFRRGNEANTYRIVGQFSADSTLVLAKGDIGLPGDNLIRMRTGFRQPVTWSYTFEASRATFRLRFGYQNFLRTLFPGGTWRESESLKMILAPDDE